MEYDFDDMAKRQQCIFTHKKYLNPMSNKTKMSDTEVVKLLLEFLDENGTFIDFKEWVQEKGYSLSELGITE